MLILSKKKDYYDGVAGTLGIDKTIVYERTEIKLKKNEMFDAFRRADYYGKHKDISPFLRLGNFFMKKINPQKYHNYSYFIIGFCGKIYVGFKLYELVGNNGVKTTITYDFEEIKPLVNTERSFNGNMVDIYNEIINYDVTSYFRKFKSPIFVYDSCYNEGYYSLGHNTIRLSNDSELIINPILADYEFYKVFDSFLAFQEIQMYISGVLGNPEKDTLNIEDKYKIAQFGFDKWSFRKEPQK
jgi:hypothetical protein